MTLRDRVPETYCEDDCVTTDTGPVCVADDTFADSTCGDPRLISATCGDGQLCLGDRCLPAACDDCGPATECVFTREGCERLGCEVPEDPCSGLSGRLTREDFLVSGASVRSMEVSYLFGSLGEPYLDLRYRYQPAPGEVIPPDTKIYLAVEDAAGATWYVHSDPARPAPGAWSFNVQEAPGWDRFFCASFDYGGGCLGEDATRAIFANGVCVKGFVATTR